MWKIKRPHVSWEIKWKLGGFLFSQRSFGLFEEDERQIYGIISLITGER
jgi:hypothetical protein